jgi:hypothetical protein
MLHFAKNPNAVVLNFGCYREFVQHKYDKRLATLLSDWGIQINTEYQSGSYSIDTTEYFHESKVAGA